MATDVTTILAATSGGLAYAGPLNTTAPTTAAETLDGAFVELGTVSDAGLVESPNTTTQTIKNWAGLSVKTIITDSEFTFKFTLLQTDKQSLELYHGGSTVADDGSTGSKIEVKKTASNQQSFVFDVLDGTNTVRIYIPTGEVTNVGDVSYVSGDAAAYELTVTAYPDENGVCLTKFFEDDFTAS